MGSDVSGLGNGIHRAELSTTSTAYALILVDGIGHEMLADLGGTLLIHNMGNIFIPEMSQSRIMGLAAVWPRAHRELALTV